MSKLSDKQKAVKDARKIYAQMEAARDQAGPPGSPFFKFFDSMMNLVSDVADETEEELRNEAAAEKMPFDDVDDDVIDDDENLGGKENV